MSKMKQTVSLTSVNSENMSRHDMLEWVNRMVQGNFKKIEELCSGVAYCQMMELIFPNCINLKRVKMNAKLEHEHLHNLKLFQAAFQRLKLDKAVPIERLIKGRFQDNFEFLQWFKKFFDSKAPGLENMKSAANAPVPKPIKPHCFNKAEPAKPEPEPLIEDGDLTLQDLASELDELRSKCSDAEELRDQYYQKLQFIELMLNQNAEQFADTEICKRVFAMLYQTMEEAEERLDGPADPNDGMY